MKIYRYYCESTEIFPEEGFLSRFGRVSCMDNTFDATQYLIQDFNDNLPFPDNEVTLYLKHKKIQMTNWFTSYGRERFSHAINECISYLKDKYGIDIRLKIDDIPENSNCIIYQDAYQVVLNKSEYDRDKFYEGIYIDLTI